MILGGVKGQICCQLLFFLSDKTYVYTKCTEGQMIEVPVCTGCDPILQIFKIFQAL